ncbi:MAG: hypothetical protein IKE23_12570, partial [Exiguobacterium sp.]|nr:hypothetical protein [Exiguobacterium sp.]
YKSQSKIQLYDDNASSTEQGLSGVKGRDIPLSALRPNQHQTFVDENGEVKSRPLSKSRIAADAEAYDDISKAYRKMNGLPEEKESTLSTNARRAKDLSSVPRNEAQYMEDMPDSDEGLLEVLALAIKNARANLEMMEALYAALSGDVGDELDDDEIDTEEFIDDEDDVS